MHRETETGLPILSQLKVEERRDRKPDSGRQDRIFSGWIGKRRATYDRHPRDTRRDCHKNAVRQPSGGDSGDAREAIKSEISPGVRNQSRSKINLNRLQAGTDSLFLKLSRRAVTLITRE